MGQTQGPMPAPPQQNTANTGLEGANSSPAQLRSQSRQGRMGNSAVTDMCGLGGGGGDVDPAAILDDTWRGRGNLIGNPPVRDPEEPPNKGIVEDEAVYNQRLAAAEATKGEQQARADGMVNADGKVTDNRYWFSRVYQFVTEGELEEARGSTYYYPSYVLQSARYFDKIYADNCAAADKGGTVETHWQRAFAVAKDEHETTLVGGLGRLAEVGEVTAGAVLGGLPGLIGGGLLATATENLIEATESLVASMQAHIRFDLPRAEAWVFSSYYQNMEDAKMANFKPDFMSMTGIFDRAAARMNVEIAEKVGLPSDLMPRMLQDWAMTYMLDADMATERADTWQRAEDLVNNGLAGTDPYTENDGKLTGNTTTTAQPTGSGLSNLPNAELKPTMKKSAAVLDDDAVRADVASNGALQKTSGERIQMLRSLMRGATLDDDEATLMTVLADSKIAGDVLTVIDGANAWDLMYATDGAESKALRRFFNANYYSGTSGSVAMTLIRRCMDGETAEWEEEMVADILVARYGLDGEDLLTRIGKAYEGGGRAEGLDKVQWQLDGADQDRVDALYDK